MNKSVNKSLVNVNENSIFFKIKRFFKKLFHKNTIKQNNNSDGNIEKNNGLNVKNDFLKAIQNIESEETKLLKLQQQYEDGQIKEEELSQKQISDLEELYNKQNTELSKSNTRRIERIKEKSNANEFLKNIENIEDEEIKLLKLQKQYENNEISEEELTDVQKKQLLELYEDQNYWLEKSNNLRKERLLNYKNRMAV